MKWKKAMAAVLTACLLLAGLSFASAESETLAALDPAKWQYNADDGVYWQIGVSYCATPVDERYETLGVFVPEAYMTATDNGDGTFTCEINPEGSVGGYTAQTAPIVLPVDTPGYSAMAAPSAYVQGASAYTDAGFVYVAAGCRGRDAGAPAGVTDLKAAIRFVRHSAETIPGDTERIFTFGMSGGGAQSALLGATGDSELYTPYLALIGAAQTSDAVAGSMCWCPITNLDFANEAYEWNLGVIREGLSEDMQALSDGMAAAYADYVNQLGLEDDEGGVLLLTGLYEGSYIDYLKGVIERSLNNFLSDTSFPYTPSQGGMGRGGFGGGRGGLGGREGMPGGPGEAGGLEAGRGEHDGPMGELTLPDGGPEEKDGLPMADGEQALPTGGYFDENGELQEDGIVRVAAEAEADTATYETAQAYIDSLNGDDPWIAYDAETNTATIASVEAFVRHCKPATKSVGAFDDLNRAQGENQLFGYGDGEGAHFDAIMAELLKDDETYGAAYVEDLARMDALGTDVQTRLNMYNPMYYLSDLYDGYQTASVAKYWRIRTGITQGDTALCTEVNLALALQGYGDTQVDFETVWGQGHVQAERTGSATENFIAWVNGCVMEE